MGDKEKNAYWQKKPRMGHRQLFISFFQEKYKA